MTEPLRLFVLAGEPSGDRLGAHLVRRLRSRVDVQASGVGGAELEGEQLRSMFPMSELSVMGWADVLPRLPKLLWRVRQVTRAILHSRPDAAVLIDSQVFSQLVAGGLRKAGYDRPILLYVAPTVWAWKSDRAAKIKPLFDEVLAVLPFEPAVMEQLGGPPTTYVGHPAIEALASRPVQPANGPLLLLPGSREGELRRHLPLMRDVTQRLAGHPMIEGFVLPTLRSLERRVADEVAGWRVPAAVVTGGGPRNDAFQRAIAALAVTGTVTLEMALAGVPMVTTYVADTGQMNLLRKYRPKFAALPNAILDRPLVPELLGPRPDPDGAAEAIRVLIETGRHAQLEGFAEIRRLMRDGVPGAPVVDPALRVLSHVPRYREAIGS